MTSGYGVGYARDVEMEFWGREGGREGSGNGEDKRGERKISESQRSGTAVD